MATLKTTILVSCAALIPSYLFGEPISKIVYIEDGLKRADIIQKPIMLMSTTKSYKGMFVEKVVGHVLTILCSRNGQPISHLGTISQIQKITGANSRCSQELVEYLTDPSICLVTVSKDINFSLAPNVSPHYTIVASPTCPTLTSFVGSQVT